MRWCLILSVLCLSCVTEKKVNRWLAENPLEAARYCSDKFPINDDGPDTKYKIDSSGLEEAYRELSHFTDSILLELSKKGIDTVYIDSIRVEVRKEIRYKFRACSDTTKVITRLVENTAVITALKLENEALRKTVTTRDVTISAFDKKVSKYKKMSWALGVLVILLLLYITRKMWLKFVL